MVDGSRPIRRSTEGQVLWPVESYGRGEAALTGPRLSLTRFPHLAPRPPDPHTFVSYKRLRNIEIDKLGNSKSAREAEVTPKRPSDPQENRKGLGDQQGSWSPSSPRNLKLKIIPYRVENPSIGVVES